MGNIFPSFFYSYISLCNSEYQNWLIPLIFRLRGKLSTLQPITLINSALQSNRSIPGSPEETEAREYTSAISCLSGPSSLITFAEHFNGESALQILKALVENCGQKFQSMCLKSLLFLDPTQTTGTFADGHLTDAFKNIAIDPNADKRVKKKLILVLASWREQFSSDPSMALVAGLYKQCRGDGRRISQQELADTMGLTLTPEEKRVIEKDEMRKKGKQEKASKAQDRQKKKRIPFEFEKVFFADSFCDCRLIRLLKERPKVLASIVDGSQASSNLVNAITVSILLSFEPACYNLSFPAAGESGQ